MLVSLSGCSGRFGKHCNALFFFFDFFGGWDGEVGYLEGSCRLRFFVGDQLGAVALGWREMIILMKWFTSMLMALITCACVVHSVHRERRLL